MYQQSDGGYGPIPPPPLPQFYLPPKAHCRDIFAATTAYDDARTTFMTIPARRADVTVDPKPKIRKLISCSRPQDTFNTSETMKCSGHPKESVHSRQPKAATQIPPGCDTIAPMAIYHICRICLRPRSTTFHQQNPIPLNGVPPPPGICRRCRIAPVEDIAKVAGVVTQCESNDIKLGVKCAVPSQYIYSHRQVEALREKNQKARYEDGKTAKTYTPRDLRYRHIEVDMSRAPTINSSDDERRVPEHIWRPSTVGSSERKAQKPLPGSESGQGDRTDSDMRRIAREEVERYRQAERKLQAHPDPFAHGRLIPTTRQAIHEEVKTERHPRRQSSTAKTPLSQQERTSKASPKSKSGAETQTNRIHRSSTTKACPSLKEPHHQTQSRSTSTARTPAQSRYSSREDEHPPSVLHVIQPSHIKLREVVGLSDQMERSHRQRRDSVLDLQDDKPVKAYYHHDVQGKLSPSGHHAPVSVVHRSPPRHASVRQYRDAYRERLPHGGNEELEANSDRQEQMDSGILTEKQNNREPRCHQPKEWPEDDYMLDDCPRDEHHNMTAKNSGFQPSVSSQNRKDDSIRETDIVRKTTDWRDTDANSQGDAMARDHSTNTHNHAPNPASKGFHDVEAGPRHNKSTRRSHCPPYPEDSDDLIPMPSPDLRSTRVQPASPNGLGSSLSQPRPGEYFYMERTTQPIRRAGDARIHPTGSSTYQCEKEELLVRGRPPVVGTKQRVAHKTLREQVLRASGDSSHVSFSQAVDFSPTPPRSDASSDQFRDFSKKLRGKADSHKGPRLDRILNSDRYPKECENVAILPVKHKDESCPAGDHRHDRMQRLGAARSERPRTHAGTTRSHSHVPLAQALSESPSRENLRAVGAGPPYREVKAPGGSLAAQYGSDEEWEKDDREYKRRSRR